jgi:hypothetical protein
MGIRDLLAFRFRPSLALVKNNRLRRRIQRGDMLRKSRP